VLFKNQEEVEVDDTCIGRPTFCMDLSKALLELLQRSGIFHYAGGKPSSRYEIATEMLEMAQTLKLPIKCRSIKRAAKSIFTVPRPEYSALDTSRVESILNYRPRPWKNALEEFLKDG
jgi:dTDP-4-dehydrorhamnose reductase